MISDAQARLLALAERGPVLAWQEPGRQTAQVARLCESPGDGSLDHHGPTYGVERLIDVDPDVAALVPLGTARLATLLAVRGRELVETRDVDVLAQRIGSIWFVAPRTIRTSELEITDLGRIELGRWRRRQAERPAEIPPLAPDAAELLLLCEQLRRLGFAVVPVSGRARLWARRLARGPHAHRTYASGLGLLPTDLALVELLPDEADRAPARPTRPAWLAIEDDR